MRPWSRSPKTSRRGTSAPSDDLRRLVWCQIRIVLVAASVPDTVRTSGRLHRVEGGGFGFPFGGDPEDLMRGLQEFAAKQAESVAEAQREQFATLTLNTAVALTAAALQRVEAAGGPDEQAIALRDAMRVLVPEAVALVSAARQGFMRER